MQIYVDIDNTICTFTEKQNYSNAIPIKENILKVNSLYDLGHTVIAWTARGTLTQLNWFKITLNQLNSWGLKFHELRMGKPAYDLLIDDKALNSLFSWSEENVERIIGKKTS
jgi:hypothetical protein